MKWVTTLILAACCRFAGAQTFYSNEDFYQFLEHRQRMALVEAQARAWAAAQEREQERREFEDLPLYDRSQKWKLHDWELE